MLKVSWFCPPSSVVRCVFCEVNGCRRVALNVLSRSNISRQGQRMEIAQMHGMAVVIYAGRSKVEGENGLIDSTSGHVSNRFWKYKVN